MRRRYEVPFPLKFSPSVFFVNGACIFVNGAYISVHAASVFFSNGASIL